MITVKLKEIYLVTIVLFLVHAVEEYFTHFPTVDPILTAVASKIPLNPNFLFILLQIIWTTFLVVVFFIAPSRGKFSLSLMVLVGLVLIFELEHLIRAIMSQSYYPGLATAILLAIVGFTFWNELTRGFKRRKLNE